VNHKVDALHPSLDRRTIAHIARNDANVLIDVAVMERGDVERRDPLAFSYQVANQVDAEEPGPAGD